MISTPTRSFARRAAGLCAAMSLVFTATAMAGSFVLTPAQTARLQKYLPHTYPKLVKKEPVNVLTLGDSVMDMTVYDDNAGNVLESYAGRFLGMLGDQFYYTGGVRRANVRRGRADKLLKSAGPEIILNSGARGGKLMIHGIQVLSTELVDDKPDLALVCFGINDANSSLDLATYRRSLQEIVDTLKAKGVDTLLFGPTPVVPEPLSSGLAITAPYSKVMKEVADQSNVFYCDLGDLAWMVQVNDTYWPMRRGEPTKKPAAGNGPTKPDPADLKRAEELFELVTHDMHTWFDHRTTVDTIHPNTTAHRMLARRVFSELLDGPKTVPWSIGSASLDLDGDGKASVTFRLENTSGEKITLAQLPLTTPGWKPVAPLDEIELKAGRRIQVGIDYEQVSASFPAQEQIIRLPVLMIGKDVARIEVLDAVISPVSVTWKAGAQWNQTGTSTLEGSIANTTKEPQQGTWESAFFGEKQTGSFDLQPGAAAPVKLTLPLPKDDAAPDRQKSPLTFTVTAGKLTLPFHRTIEISRNIGLKQNIAMLHDDGKIDVVAGKTDASPGVAFHAEADAKELRLVWDIHNLKLQDPVGGGDAVNADVSLDARSFGKRLGPGVVEAIRVIASAAGGDCNIAGLHAWNFGNGYVKDFDLKELKAKLSKEGDTSHRLTFTIPRSFFYLHEWALKNGNSELGIQANIRLALAPDAANPKGIFTGYTLLNTGLHRDEAEALTALELTEQPTARWTVRLY